MSGISSPPRTATSYLVFVWAAFPPLFWAGNFLVARAMRDTIPPFQMSFWRWLVAFFILLPFGLPYLRSNSHLLRREWPFLVLLGAVGVTAFNCFIYVALHHTTVVNAALINSLMPVATFLLALTLLRERLTTSQVFGVILAIVGAAIVIARGQPAQLLQLGSSRGEVLVLAGLTSWAAYTVLIKWRPTRLPMIAFLTSTIGFGTLFHLPLAMWERHVYGGFEVTSVTTGAILFLAIFPSILAYVLWNRAVATIGPGRTGMFMYLMPVFSAVLAVWFLDEPLQLYHLAGVLLIFLGIALVTGLILRK